MNIAHKAELLHCGCRVIPATGETVVHCARHACNRQAEFTETNKVVGLPVDPSGCGLKPNCPACSSFRIKPTADNIVCLHCRHEFMPSDVNAFAISFDTKPRHCHKCNAITYGACFCYQY